MQDPRFAEEWQIEDDTPRPRQWGRTLGKFALAFFASTGFAYTVGALVAAIAWWRG